jgi:uncharacterized protein with HEPN domain
MSNRSVNLLLKDILEAIENIQNYISKNSFKEWQIKRPKMQWLGTLK